MALMKYSVNQEKKYIFVGAALVTGFVIVYAIVASAVLTSTKREQITATFAPNLQTLSIISSKEIETTSAWSSKTSTKRTSSTSAKTTSFTTSPRAELTSTAEILTSSAVPISMTGARQTNTLTSETTFEVITTTPLQVQSTTAKMLSKAISSTSKIGSRSPKLTTTILPLPNRKGTAFIVTKGSSCFLRSFRTTQYHTYL